MSIRDTDAYKNMTQFNACGTIEGFGLEQTEENLQAAWQYIYDSGLYRVLQGFYGRACRDLLENGDIEPLESEEEEE